MINPGYKISANDVKELQEFKSSAAYSNYLKAISQSPAFISVMNEHINKVDITKDVEQLKSEGKLPQELVPKFLVGLFKLTLNRMAIGILADSIILKELEDCNVDVILNTLRKDSDIIYLLGQADKKYYVQAEHLLNEGKIDSSSLVFRGLMAYIKLNNKEFNKPQETSNNLIQEKKPTVLDNATSNNKSKQTSTVDLSSDNIVL